jgi:mannose-1-phosphate guanylyltransferase
MIVVIIAGGSGTRLWPLSTHNYPKHLLTLMGKRSLVQNTFDRVKNLTDDIFVVSEASHIKHVYEQLKEVPKKNILVEPGRRGTASCVILALSEIKKRKYDDQPILFLWADHLIRDKRGFISSAKQAAKLADEHKQLVFMGIDYLKLLDAKNPEKVYMDFESEPIDTALSEHVPDALVVPGAFDWVDVGSFNDLHSISFQDEDGNHINGDNIELERVSNSYVRNEQKLPVAVIGLDNVAVIATENGILVTNQTYAQKVGDIAKRLQER